MSDLADELCELARSLFERGLTPGTSGNISVRLDDGFLVTPTNACLGRLRPDRLACLTAAGVHTGGEAPTKEWPLHRAFYATRPQARAVVHLHSPWAVALSCLEGLDPETVLPAYTPYPVMRLGRVPLLPYFPPGDPAMGSALEALQGRAKAVLLANHGPAVADVSLAMATAAIEELEEAARLAFVLSGHRARQLTRAEWAELTNR